MTMTRTGALALLALGLTTGTALAHFQEVIPNPPLVTQDTGNHVVLSLTFTHPMDNGPAMEMAPPQAFNVTVNGRTTSLLDTLKETTVGDARAYTADVAIDGPGDYVFGLTPAPYWEPAEGKMIIHYTKVVVDAYDAGEGWDTPLGQPVEIMPLTRPYGLYTGNLFSGVVTKAGAPVPYAEIEVEYRSEGKIQAPAGVFVTQVVRADGRGVFHYAMPKAGWWGFAALVDGDKPLANPEGKEVPVELGGLMWVNVVDMPTAP